jgi:hypothetical protein
MEMEIGLEHNFSRVSFLTVGGFGVLSSVGLLLKARSQLMV